MSAQAERLSEVNLEDDAFVEGVPHDTFARLRREAPVYWYRWRHGKGFWAVTRHRDIVAVLADWRSFTSEYGANLEDLAPDQAIARRSMLETDPPRHTRLRKLVSLAFSPRAVAAYEPFVRELARDILQRALSHGEFDFIEEVAAQLPMRALARILGIPDADTGQLVAWSDEMMGNTDPELAQVPLFSSESERYRLYPFRSPAAYKVFDYGRWLAAQRRKDPRDDLVTRLVFAQIDGRPLTEHEFDNMFLLLVVAGNETTRQAIAHGLLAFQEHPDQISRLQDDPSLLPTAVEEILRWASPILHFRRTAVRDVELRGQTIRAGDKVVLWFVSGNRDEEVFPDPFRFDVGRMPNDHLTFGKSGVHYCLGAHLARLEIRVLFSELLPYLNQLRVSGKPIRMRSNFTNGIKRLPVRFEPR